MTIKLKKKPYSKKPLGATLDDFEIEVNRWFDNFEKTQKSLVIELQRLHDKVELRGKEGKTDGTFALGYTSAMRKALEILRIAIGSV